jgi:predicted protein tyrosine phosphatase
MTSVHNHFLEAIVSKREMKILSLSPHFNAEKVVLVSIQDPDDNEDLTTFKNKFKDSLTLKFWDTEDDLGVSSNGYPVIPIDEKEANKFIDFLIKNKEEKFFIHCAAGQSRSAGVGLALETILKFNGDKYLASQFPSDIKDNKRYSPNLKVYDVIVDTFNKRNITLQKNFLCPFCNLSFDKYIKNEKKCPICFN